MMSAGAGRPRSLSPQQSAPHMGSMPQPRPPQSGTTTPLASYCGPPKSLSPHPRGPPVHPGGHQQPLPAQIGMPKIDVGGIPRASTPEPIRDRQHVHGPSRTPSPQLPGPGVAAMGTAGAVPAPVPPWVPQNPVDLRRPAELASASTAPATLPHNAAQGAVAGPMVAGAPPRALSPHLGGQHGHLHAVASGGPQQHNAYSDRTNVRCAPAMHFTGGNSTVGTVGSVGTGPGSTNGHASPPVPGVHWNGGAVGITGASGTGTGSTSGHTTPAMPAFWLQRNTGQAATDRSLTPQSRAPGVPARVAPHWVEEHGVPASTGVRSVPAPVPTSAPWRFGAAALRRAPAPMYA